MNKIILIFILTFQANNSLFCQANNVKDSLTNRFYLSTSFGNHRQIQKSTSDSLDQFFSNSPINISYPFCFSIYNKTQNLYLSLGFHLLFSQNV